MLFSSWPRSLPWGSNSNRSRPVRSRRQQRRPTTVRPCCEQLEDRCLPAQILFGGAVLKESFDDVSLSGVSFSGFTDPGFLADGHGGFIQEGTVFSHAFNAEVFLGPGGDTTPTHTDQSAQDLELITGTDTISIQPYLPPGAGSAEVDLVSLDLKINSVGLPQVVIQGQNGQETLSLNAPVGTWSTLGASNQDVIGKDARGNDVTLGAISQITVSARNVVEFDNLRAVVFFPGISVPPVAKDDVYELPHGGTDVPQHCHQSPGRSERQCSG